MATSAIENEVMTLERQFWQAMKDRDSETAMRLTDDSCILAGPQGVSEVSRDQFPAMIERPGYTLRDFQLKDAHVRMIGEDVALVGYQAHEELTVDGKPVSLDAVEASTWVRRNGQWVCALHTEALSGDPFGRDRQAVAQRQAR